MTGETTSSPGPEMEDHDTELNTAVLGSPAVSTDGTENGDAALLAAGQDNGNYDVAVGDAGQEKRHSKVLKSRKKKRKKKKRKKKKRGPQRKEHEALVFTFTLRRFVDTCLSTCEAMRSGNENAEQGRVYSPTYKDVLGTHWRVLVCHNFKCVHLDHENATSKLRLSKSPVQAAEGQGGQHIHTAVC